LISEKEFEQIETEANKIVKQAIKTNLEFLPRTKAEQKYGMEIYQGGAVPGKLIRIVHIPGVDVEACGGTHVNNTSEIEEIKLIKTNKVKDGVVRIMFAAGNAARQLDKKETGQIDEVAKLLEVKPKQIPARALELFTKWKQARKAVEKAKPVDLKAFELTSKEEYEGDVLSKTAELVKTQVPHLITVLSRFKKELDEFKGKLKEFK